MSGLWWEDDEPDAPDEPPPSGLPLWLAILLVCLVAVAAWIFGLLLPLT